jgi:hypothetical protein
MQSFLEAPKGDSIQDISSEAPEQNDDGLQCECSISVSSIDWEYIDLLSRGFYYRQKTRVASVKAVAKDGFTSGSSKFLFPDFSDVETTGAWGKTT